MVLKFEMERSDMNNSIYSLCPICTKEIVHTQMGVRSHLNIHVKKKEMLKEEVKKIEKVLGVFIEH